MWFLRSRKAHREFSGWIVAEHGMPLPSQKSGSIQKVYVMINDALVPENKSALVEYLGRRTEVFGKDK